MDIAKSLLLIVALLVAVACDTESEPDADAYSGCEFNGETYALGEEFLDECRPCKCGGEMGDEPGEVACAPMACASEICAGCGEEEVCVQSFDGQCTDLNASCVPVSATCRDALGEPGKPCPASCEVELCLAPLACAEPQPACGTESEAAPVYCYGP